MYESEISVNVSVAKQKNVAELFIKSMLIRMQNFKKYI